MPRDINAARRAVNEAIDQLAIIAIRGQTTGDRHQLMADLDRWKAGPKQDILSHVSPVEARRFGKLKMRPNYAMMEPDDAGFRRHATFLQALATEIVEHPGRVVDVGSVNVPPVMDGKPFTFISHAGGDAGLAAHLEITLRQSVPGEVFRTSRVGQIRSGLGWFDDITDHLRCAARFLVLLTPESQERPWVCFEAGAAWATGRPAVFALGGGLVPGDTIEPLKHLQLLSLEDPEQAAEVVKELGGTLADPEAFAHRVRELGRKARDARAVDGLPSARTMISFRHVHCSED